MVTPAKYSTTSCGEPFNRDGSNQPNYKDGENENLETVRSGCGKRLLGVSPGTSDPGALRTNGSKRRKVKIVRMFPENCSGVKLH